LTELNECFINNWFLANFVLAKIAFALASAAFIFVFLLFSSQLEVLKKLVSKFVFGIILNNINNLNSFLFKAEMFGKISIIINFGGNNIFSDFTDTASA
jgi:hypothetical protein